MALTRLQRQSAAPSFSDRYGCLCRRLVIGSITAIASGQSFLCAWSGAASAQSIPATPSLERTTPTVLPGSVLPGAIPPVGGSAPVVPAVPLSPMPSAPSPSTINPGQNIPVLPTSESIRSEQQVSAPASELTRSTQRDPVAYEYRRATNGPTYSPSQVSLLGGQLAAGTAIPLTVPRPMTFQAEERISTHMVVARPIVNESGQVLIPQGSRVWGSLEPIVTEEPQMVGDYRRMKRKTVGSRFVAERLDIAQSTFVLDGESQQFAMTPFHPDSEAGKTALRGAGYGAVGSVALGAVTGGLGFLPVLAIGGLGGAMGNLSTVDRAIALNPNQEFELTLKEPLLIQTQ